jgi:hypothetical protein
LKFGAYCVRSGVTLSHLSKFTLSNIPYAFSFRQNQNETEVPCRSVVPWTTYNAANT